MEKKYFLYDIVFVRLLLIFLLVFYHSFCPFVGSWPILYENFPNNEIYKWIGLLTHKFQLEAMVFISGSLYGYTLMKHPDRLSFYDSIIKKIKRILFPSFLFSIIYYMIFFDLNKPVWNIVYSVLNGCGHLWFLPMIFWCFCFCYIIEKLKFKPSLVLLFCCFLLLLPSNENLLGLGRVHRFFVFFYLGFAIKKKYINMISVNKNTILVILLVLYCFMCFLDNLIIESSPSDFFIRYSRALLMRYLHPFNAMIMIIFIFSIANKAKILNTLKKHPILITISGYCYGVYIYQQFILKYLYYKTELPFYIDPYVLPWVGLVVTLVLSIFMCHVTLKTKTGRYLIG